MSFEKKTSVDCTILELSLAAEVSGRENATGDRKIREFLG